MSLTARALAIVALAAWLGACATTPIEAPPRVDTSRTTVVLLPDEDGKVGMVSVTSADGSRNVDKAYSFTTVAGSSARPSEPQDMGEAHVKTTFQDVIKAQPPKPRSFTLYFLLDSTALTEDSKSRLLAVIEAVRERKPTEISIFGHTDAIGTPERNMKLSAARAQAVEHLLRERVPDMGQVDVRFFGANEPVIATPPNVPEPQNRRAEIMVL